MTARPRVAGAAVVAGLLALSPLMLGAAQAPQSQPASWCIPLLYCPSPAPSSPAPSSPAPGTPVPSSPTPGKPAPGNPGSGGAPSTAPVPTGGTTGGTSGGSSPGTGATGGDPAPGTAASPTPGSSSSPKATPNPSPSSTAPVQAQRENGAPIFTKTPASMGSQGLSFTGLSSIGIVSVPTIDGSTVRALKITADSITITGFSLTVRPPGGPGLVTTADSMTLKGHVSVYLGSVTATTSSGKALTLGTDTPPPLDDVKPGLLRVTMGLVGSIADSISYTNTNQRIVGS
ncbi:hypothetical protein [Arthrobacter sp. NPDC090010]|uniref:hypothetical protein n=1 Tax=Arthrobacter sp. NPDC090010 TaxID=3363942 RepID=UPI003800F871